MTLLARVVYSHAFAMRDKLLLALTVCETFSMQIQTTRLCVKYDWKRPVNLLMDFMLLALAVMALGAVRIPQTTLDLGLAIFFVSVVSGFVIYRHSHRLILENDTLRVSNIFRKTCVAVADIRTVKLVREARGKGFVVPVVYIETSSARLKIDTLLFNPPEVLCLLDKIAACTSVHRNFHPEELLECQS